MLQHDPNPPEDVLKVDADPRQTPSGLRCGQEGVDGDDAADANRYLLVATKAGGARTVAV